MVLSILGILSITLGKYWPIYKLLLFCLLKMPIIPQYPGVKLKNTKVVVKKMDEKQKKIKKSLVLKFLVSNDVYPRGFFDFGAGSD
jgi:hypothetical protein